MTVFETNDAQLRHQIHAHERVIAKFTSEGCAVCQALAPHFSRFAAEPPYRDVLFVQLNSDENPVARQLMDRKAAPFFVSYHAGKLLECDALTQDAEVRAMLDRLVAHPAA